MVTKLQGSERAVFIMGLAMVSLLLLAALLHPYFYFVLQPHHYLVAHNLLELSSILIGFSVFVVNWESSKQNRNIVNLYIGTGFVAIIGMDILHLLSHEGMPDIITPNSMNKALYYGMAARFWMAWVLWKATDLKPNRLDPYLDRSYLLSLNLVVCLITFAVITPFGNALPPLFVAGQGSTWISILLQLAVIGACFVAAKAYLKKYRDTKESSMLLIMGALIAIAISEATQILFFTPYDVYSFIGHLYKVVAYYLIFKVLTVTSVHRPYEQLKIAKDRLEQTVAKLDARNRELDALDEVAVALGATIKPEEVLETAIDRVMKVMNASAGAVLLLDESSNELQLVTWRGLPARVIEDCMSHRLSFSQPYPADEQGDGGDEWAGGSRVMEKKLGGMRALIAPLRICVCAPIVNKGRLLGSIVMFAKEGNQFSEKDSNLLTAIGYQFGLSIENARLYEQTDEWLREKIQELQRAELRSRFLYEVGALFASEMELNQVLNLVAMKSVDVLGDCCDIYLIDEQSNSLRLEAIYCKEKRELEIVRNIFSRRPIPVGVGIIGKVAQSGEPVLQSAVKREEFIEEIRPRIETAEELSFLKMKVPTSRIVVPMRAFGRTLGVMVVFSTKMKQPLGDADLSLMVELAGRVGVAIENRRLFQESQSQRMRLEAIITHMVDGVVVTDNMGRPIVINRSAERMLANREKVLIEGNTPVDICGESSSGNGYNQRSRLSLIERALAGELITGEEVYGSSVKGDCILSASASPIRDETGAITGAVVVLRDVTAEREVEKMKDEFVATTSHELRTPITAVMGYTDLLLKGIQGPLTSKQKDALESISNASKRLLRLINDLLDMSRLEAGRQEVVLAPVELAEVAEKVISETEMLAVPKRITISNTIKKDLPLVLADDEQLQRILGNLLSNAIKFTDPGGKVTLSAFVGGLKRVPKKREHQVRPGEMAVTITDTGIGIPLEYQDKIWDKFRQVDSSTRRLFGGTGLGLAIAQRLVQLHGGRVWVESDGVPGKGSTFGFTLRLAEESRRNP